MAELVDEMGEVVAGGVEVLVLVLLLCPGYSQEEPSKARTSRYHPMFQVKKLKPRKETALSFHARKKPSLLPPSYAKITKTRYLETLRTPYFPKPKS